MQRAFTYLPRNPTLPLNSLATDMSDIMGNAEHTCFSAAFQWKLGWWVQAWARCLLEHARRMCQLACSRRGPYHAIPLTVA